MIFRDKTRVRLTRSELNLLRQRNAQNGIVIAEVKTTPQLLEAVIGGLSPERADDLLAFMDAHSTSDGKDPDVSDDV